MAFATLWAGISARTKLRFATAGIAAVAEEVVSLLSAERVALFAAVDAADAPEALMRRAALIRAYINNRLGGIHEERALEAELEASLGLGCEAAQPTPTPKKTAPKAPAKKAAPKKPIEKPASRHGPARRAKKARVSAETVPASDNVIPDGELAVQTVVASRPVPTSPIPGQVVQVNEKPAAEKTSADRAREAHENALVEVNVDTPARKPERIVPQPKVLEKRHGVQLEAHQRLREAYVVMTVAALDGLLREGRCFITGRRFKEGDRITLVNHKLVANYDLVRDLVREHGHELGWSWISIPLARDVLGDWENFVKEHSSKKKAEIWVAMLRARLETVEDQILPDSGIRGDDLTCAYFWRHLLKVAIRMEEYNMERVATEEKRAAELAEQKRIAAIREEDRKVRLAKLDEEKKAVMDAARENFKTRGAIKQRHAEIRARHAGIKGELAGLEVSVMDATKKTEKVAALKLERDTLGMEFEVLTEFWKDLPEDDARLERSYRVEDSARSHRSGNTPGVLPKDEQERRAKEKKAARLELKLKRKEFRAAPTPTSKKKGQDAKPDKKAQKRANKSR